MESSKTLTIVLDTNILLVSISSRSKYHWLYDTLLKGKYQIAFTHEILLEYEELISKQWSSEVAINVIRSVTELPNALFIPVYFRMNLIAADKDDNKFVDCAFAANADYIVTHDRHFDILKTIPFPQIPLVDIQQFKALLKSEKLI